MRGGPCSTVRMLRRGRTEGAFRRGPYRDGGEQADRRLLLAVEASMMVPYVRPADRTLWDWARQTLLQWRSVASAAVAL